MATPKKTMLTRAKDIPKAKGPEFASNLTHKLNAQQLKFVEHYIRYHNGTAAAKHAGYAPKSAGVQASQLLSTPRIREYIDAVFRSHHISADQIVGRLSQMAMADVTQFVDASGRINKTAIKEQGYLVKKIKPGANGMELEIHDPQKALDMLGRHHRLWEGENAGGQQNNQYIFNIGLNDEVMLATGPKPVTPVIEQPKQIDEKTH